MGIFELRFNGSLPKPRVLTPAENDLENALLSFVTLSKIFASHRIASSATCNYEIGDVDFEDSLIFTLVYIVEFQIS